jgi:hypothetical protein
MGLLVDVFKNGSTDCTRGGISSQVSELLLVNVQGPIGNQAQHYQKAMLVPGNGPGLVKIVPAFKTHPEDTEWRPDPRHCMMGGNYASTSDSRFHAAVRWITGHESYGAVPIHDRIE